MHSEMFFYIDISQNKKINVDKSESECWKRKTARKSQKTPGQDNKCLFGIVSKFEQQIDCPAKILERDL